MIIDSKDRELREQWQAAFDGSNAAAIDLSNYMQSGGRDQQMIQSLQKRWDDLKELERRLHAQLQSVRLDKRG